MTRAATPDEHADHERDLRKHDDSRPQPDAPYCPFCKKTHEGGDTCMGHYP